MNKITKKETPTKKETSTKKDENKTKIVDIETKQRKNKSKTSNKIKWLKIMVITAIVAIVLLPWGLMLCFMYHGKVDAEFYIENVQVGTNSYNDIKDITNNNSPEIPEKTGYEGVWQITNQININQKIRVEAVYIPKAYTVKFNINGARTDGWDCNYTGTIRYNQKVGILPTPNRDFYKFNGWKYGESEITSDTIWNKDTDEIINFIADWSEDYTTQFDYEILGDNTVKVTGIGTFTGSYLNIPETINNRKITKIGSNAFSNNQTLLAVKFSQKMEIIEEGAFAHSNITYVEGMTNVEAIGDYAFAYSKLKNIEFSNTLKEISRGAFCSCLSLTKVEIPPSVTLIGYSAFYDCRALKEITLPGHITTLDDFILKTTAIEEITIPETVSTIKDNAFSQCDNLKNVYIDSYIVCENQLSSGSNGNLCLSAEKIYIKTTIDISSVGNYIQNNYTNSENRIVSHNGVLYNEWTKNNI